MTEAKQYCSFTVEKLLFGVEVCDVQEVIRHQQMARVPLATRELGGLINLRGQIVTAIDMRPRLQLPDRAPEALAMNVVVRVSDEVVSLMVDEIGDVINVEADLFEKPPETLTGVARELVTGVYKLKDRLLLVLDTTKAITLEARSKAA
jgi:purine-binding chemotaxis protein CheW